MKTIKTSYPYQYMNIEDRAKILPERNVCSVTPAKDKADYLYSGNGSHRIDISGDPYQEEIIVTQELLYEPQWEKTPLPADLRPYIKDIRRYVLEGKPELADELVDKAQREASMDQYMNLDAKIVYPTGSPRVHKAFSIICEREKQGVIHNYLRFLDMSTGKITTHWEEEDGVFENEVLPVFKDDFVVMRFKAPKKKLSMKLNLHFPGGPNMFGQPTMVNAFHSFKIEDTSVNSKIAVLSWGYNPKFGNKGYVTVWRFTVENGSMETADTCINVKNADILSVYTKTVKIEENFHFGCEDDILHQFMEIKGTFDELIKKNDGYLGERMRRSQIYLMSNDHNITSSNIKSSNVSSHKMNASKFNNFLSGEELLKRCHEQEELDATLMNKLYDMGRFYQIIDTGKIPPMWGQHNINTNLQVCAGNNTGLFDEMDVYFRYYESKLEDFRTNAKLLFGARGLLASVHCDYDSGLFYHFSRSYPHYCFTGVLGWVYNELWGYYLCTGDMDFLKNRVVPGLKEIALFFEDYACDKDESGKVIFYPSFSPEDPTPNPGYETVTCKDIHPTRINAVMDIAICREVLTNLIEALRTLDMDQEQIAHYEKQLADLPDYLLDEEGALKEWSWPSIEENYNHRHVSHHYDLWPGRAVTMETEPEVAKAIMISNRKRGQQDDSAHGIIHRALCAIRLKDKDELMQNLSQLINHGFVRTNLSTAHFPYRGQFPDLQGAMPAILLEMCVFSMPGVIEFLPAMPEDFKEGTLEGIWLYTWAKLESLHFNENGMEASIVSYRAQNITIRFRRAMQSEQKKCSILRRCKLNGEYVELVNGEVNYSFKAGEKLQIEVYQ